MLTFGAIVPVLAAGMAIADVDGRYIRNLDPGIDGGTGNLIVEVFVAPDRRVEGCRIIYSTLPEAGRQRVCEQARKMAASTVATDADGNPVYGFVTLARIMRSGPSAARFEDLLPADLNISVEDIPGRDTRKTVQVTVLVASNGEVASCQPPARPDRNYGEVACEQLAGESFPIAYDRDGTAVRYVKLITAEFIEDSRDS